MKKILFLLSILLTSSFSDTDLIPCCSDGKSYNGDKFEGVYWDLTHRSDEITQKIVSLYSHQVCKSYGLQVWNTEVTPVSQDYNDVLVTYTQYVCDTSPVCDENSTLDATIYPSVCVDDNNSCETPDIPFPPDENGSTYSEPWKATDENAPILKTQCTDNNGTIEREKLVCIDYERCKTQKPCDQNNTDYDQVAENQIILFSWKEGESDRSAECISKDNNGTVQTRRVNCKNEYRCLKVTEGLPKVCYVEVGSYVSPSDGTFHEDIEITGTEIGLHYSSGNLDENNAQTIAYGWSLNNNVTLNENKLTLGSGSLWIVEPAQEGDITVVKSGNVELLFDDEDKHIQTRDIITKETLYTFSYDAQGLLSSIADRFTNMTTLNRGTDGVLTSITAPHGQMTYLNIDENGDLLEVQYEDTSSYSFEYEEHLITVEREPNGNEFIHIFDAYGKVIKVIDAEQGEWLFGNDIQSTLLQTDVTRASGDTIRYKKHFLENGILKTEKILPTEDTILYENAVDDTTSSTTMCGMQSTRDYKTENGELYKDPFTQNRVLEKTTTTTPSGLSKLTAFDTSYLFAGTTLIQKTNTLTSNGATTTSTKDYNQSIQTTTSPEGIKAVQTYDPANTLLLSSKFGDLFPTTYSYDTQGRVTQVIQGIRTTTYTYDIKGNLATVTDPEGKSTSYSYDLRDRVTSITYPDGHSTCFSYDANGNMTVLTTPTPTDHTFSYNGVNKNTGYTSPLQSTTTYTYDEQRRVTQVTKPSGKSIDTIYTNGRITAVASPEGTTSYQYDCQSNPSSITRGDESFTFTYDGTLLTSMTQSGLLNQTLSYSYNNDFNIDSFTYAGQTTNYSYNKDQQLIQADDFILTRDINNSFVRELSDETLTQKRDYNDYGELTKLSDDTFTYQLQRDHTKIIRKTETITKYVEVENTKTNKGKGNDKTKYKKVKIKVTYDYVFDERDRLIEVYKDRDLVEQYSYDANGNRASASITGITTTASYTLDDQLVVYGDNSYRYNEDGYLEEKVTPKGTTTYTYGTMGELREVITPTQSITYQHNALNQRTAKLIDGQVVEKYLWAELTTLLAVYGKDNNLVQRFEYAGQRMPVSMTNNGQKYYLHYDQVGSLRAVSDTNKNIIKEITYDTYGNILSDSNKAFKVPFGFAGGLYDQDTKLTRFGYRDFDAYTGKWTAKDPIGFAGGDSNLYGYVLGDPVNYVDPEGLAKHDPNSQYCKNLRTKLKKIQEKIRQRYDELDANSNSLPRLSNSGKLRDSIKGHRILLTEYRRNFYKIADKYDDECGGPPSNGTCNASDPNIDFTINPDLLKGIISGMGAAGLTALGLLGGVLTL